MWPVQRAYQRYLPMRNLRTHVSICQHQFAVHELENALNVGAEPSQPSAQTST